jgi:hypothetical protein
MGRRPDAYDSGQALVESALTLPLTLFLVLGTLQLFLILQGRVMAQYAATRATRAGSLKHGSCDAMRDTSIAALLPTFTRSRTPLEVAEGYRVRRNGRYVPSLDLGHDESIVWLIRESPRRVLPYEEEEFDLASGRPRTLGLRLVFWYPMKIPFANWVINTITRATFRLGNLAGANPLMTAQRTSDWSGQETLNPQVGAELVRRAAVAHYVMPIQVTSSMRMMTPARQKNFVTPECDPYP